jgi:UPF0755 protein
MSSEPPLEPASGPPSAEGSDQAGDPTDPPRRNGSVPPGRRRTPAPRRRALRLAALAVIGGGVAVLVALWLWVASEAAPAAAPGPQVVVTVADGAGWNQVTGQLAQRGVIGSALAYRIWSQLHSLPGVQPGAYAIDRGAGFAQVRQVLAGGPNVELLAVPPGFTVDEVAARVGQLSGHTARAFRAEVASGAVRSPYAPPGTTSLEGLLGTGTYAVLPGESDRTLLRAMVARFDATAAAVHLTAGAARLGRTPYEVVTIASIVQKEGVIAKNLGPVARVILNRLAKGMPLQMDSTVLYALGQDGGPVTAADLKVRTPYNTYLHSGLTPTPTCLPSRAALEAALDPPAGPWLFFVVVAKDGTEAFSTTFAEQQANEALAARRGLG